MARVRNIVAPLLAAAAVSILTGCRPKDMQRCVDENNNVVDDKLCANLPNAPANGQQPVVGPAQPGMPIYPLYRWYYGGGGGYGFGSRVYGGGYVPEMGHSYGTSVTRGGFGSSFFGGGE